MSISKATFMGGAIEDWDLTVLLTSGAERVRVVDTNMWNVTYKLPDARTLKVGGPHFFLLRPTTMIGFPAFVRDNANNLLETLGISGEGAAFYLVDNTVQAGVWIWKKTAIG